MATGWNLSIKMMPYIRREIGAIPSGVFYDIDTAPIERDMKEATDLVLKLSGGDIAVRVRGHKYLYPHPYNTEPLSFDWSVRFKARYGHRTEIDKLREGFAKWYFFAMANEDETDIFDYALLDLDKIRSEGILDQADRWMVHPNYDGSSGGYYPMRDLLDLGCVVYHKNIMYDRMTEDKWPATG